MENAKEIYAHARIYYSPAYFIASVRKSCSVIDIADGEDYRKEAFAAVWDGNYVRAAYLYTTY